MFLSCNSRQSQIDSTKSIFQKNEKLFDTLISTLSQTVNNSYLSNETEIFSQASATNPFDNILWNKALIDFLLENNFHEIHIYNKYKCDSGKIEHLTYAFITADGTILQHDKCSRLAPKISGSHEENTRAIFEKVNDNWVIISEFF